MTKAATTTTPNSQLLIAGASEYPQAFAALSEFVRSVKTMLQQAIEAELPALSTSMGIDIPTDLKFRLNPAKLGNAGGDGDTAKIGFAIWGDPDWRQYFYVSWNEGLAKEKTISLSVTVKFLRDLQAPVAARSKLKASHTRYEIDADGKEVYLWVDIPQSDIVSLQTIMHDMLKIWAEGWRKAGGIKAFLSTAK